MADPLLMGDHQLINHEITNYKFTICSHQGTLLCAYRSVVSDEHYAGTA